MEKYILTITRDKAYVGRVMPFRIKINGVEVAKISCGGEVILEVPNHPFQLDFEMVGNSMNFHPIKESVSVEPIRSTGQMKCHLVTKPNWAGILVSGIFFPVGKLITQFTYL